MTQPLIRKGAREALFSSRLIEWQKRHGRHDLPWQGTRDPYRIWLSEMMLQQTQVATVIPYYERFVACFPNIAMLAAANEDDLLTQWSGLGYYARARNLHRAARRIMAEFGGVFPSDFALIGSLPGIGRTTAAAISVFAFGDSRAILDGNVKRVLCRVFGIEGSPSERSVEDQLWRKAESLLPEHEVAAYTQALMDLGAMICARSRPRCNPCPLNTICVAFNSDRTSELPSPKARSKLREKQTQWLVLLSRGQVLLEKRPSTGVWGSLWCFPELPMHADAQSFCLRHYGETIASHENLPPFSHAFTHFKLLVAPSVLELKKRGVRAQEPGRMWLDIAGATRAAVPTPVRRILQTLVERNQSQSKGSGLKAFLSPQT